MDDDFFVMMRLVDAGFGTFNEVQEFDARTVLRMLAWIKFKSDYDKAWIELNK